MNLRKKTGKNSAKPSRQKSAVPRTAQQSIPMQRMFEDGTCRVKNGYYTRTVEFQDINYQLALPEDRTAIYEEWCSFLNFFDSSIHFELSFVNTATDSTEFEKSIRIPFQKDGFDDVRAEYSQMLRQQLSKGNNGLTKRKYLTFGVSGESMQQVKARLDHIQNDLLNNFHRLGVQAKPLDGRERLKLMHGIFNLDGEAKFYFDWQRLAAGGLTVKDAIAPTALRSLAVTGSPAKLYATIIFESRSFKSAISVARQRIAIISDATVMIKWSSLTTPSALAPSPITILRSALSFISRHLFHTTCLVSIPRAFPCCIWLSSIAARRLLALVMA